MDPDVTNTGFPASGGKLPVKVPRLIRIAIDGREDEPIVLPGICSTEAVGALALGAELKGGNAYARQRPYSGRARRLGLSVAKLMIGSLELPPHMDFSGLEVDIHFSANLTGMQPLYPSLGDAAADRVI